jgi:transcriptional regulator with XRE-family HTH domain
MVAFTDRLRVARMRRGWTLRELGEACSVSTACLSRIEQGKSMPHPKNARKLCEVLGVDIEYLFDFSGTARRPVKQEVHP